MKQNSPAVQSSNVERLADYVDTGTTIFDIVTRYPLSQKMFSHTEYRLVTGNTSFHMSEIE